MPTLPPLSILIRSTAAEVVAVPNTNAVLFTVVENVASASAQMLAPAKMASLPSDSRGALKFILPNWSSSTIVNSFVANVRIPAAAAQTPAGP